VGVTVAGATTDTVYSANIINTGGANIAPTVGPISYKPNAGSVSIWVGGGGLPVTLGVAAH
jgi:hypothetical protein